MFDQRRISRVVTWSRMAADRTCDPLSREYNALTTAPPGNYSGVGKTSEKSFACSMRQSQMSGLVQLSALY